MTAPNPVPERPPLALALKEFAAHAAHEISNPLNAIGINAELAVSLLGMGRVAETIELLKRLTGDCWSCGQEVRTFARLGATFGETPQLQPLDQLLPDVCTAIAAQTRRPPEQFVCSLPADLPPVRVERYGLVYALTYLSRRLLTAALRHLRFSAVAERDAVRLCVTCENDPAAAGYMATRAPVGLGFIEQVFASQQIRLTWRLDGVQGYELLLPV